MKIYYVSIHRCIEMRSFEIDITYFFNSMQSMNKWIEEFNEHHSSLDEITSYGEAYFNERGILTP